ncbi:MAG: hypothetical protein KJO36_00395 [Acidimicrobiia bacterium]|nr:hypothetical protein [Acidimicrobiia bacterium]
MADLTITAANVIAASGATTKLVTAGATITAGDAVYEDTSDSNEYKLCDADVAGTADCDGIALTGSSDGQPLVIITKGDLNPGATATLGETYVVSTTAGGIAPISDLGSGDFVTILGVATTTSNIAIDIQNSATAKA